MGDQKLNKCGWARDDKTIGEHIMNHHMVAAAEGRRHHVVKGAAHNYVVTCCSFSIGPAMFFQRLAIVFSALAQPYLFSLGQTCIVFQRHLVPKNMAGPKLKQNVGPKAEQMWLGQR
jgi:hypothetical protein